MVNKQYVHSASGGKCYLTTVTTGATSDRIEVKRKRNRSAFTALTLALCLTASSFFGFIGGYVSEQVKPTTTMAIDGAGALHQAALRPLAIGGVNDGTTMTIAQVAAAVKQSVVEITTETATSRGRFGQFISTGAGSGIIVSDDGYIVTNYHVVSGASDISVRLSDGTEYRAMLKGTDAKTDLAVLKIDAYGLTPAVFGDSAALLVGEPAVAVGNPLGELGGTVTGGIISALDREISIDGEAMSLLQTDAAINPGNSGGGLFNLRGELVGVVNAKSSGSDIEGLGFAIPINTARKVVEDIIAHGYVLGRIDTGLTLVDVSDTYTAMMYRLNQLGLYISRSVDAGFKSGDRIIAVDNATITNLAGFNAALNQYRVGDTIQLTVVRSGQRLTVSLTLTELRT